LGRAESGPLEHAGDGEPHDEHRIGCTGRPTPHRR
jgi:hypothetical protein